VNQQRNFDSQLVLKCLLVTASSLTLTTFVKSIFSPVAYPIKLFSLLTMNFSTFFAVKLGHFISNNFFLYVTNMQAK